MAQAHEYLTIEYSEEEVWLTWTDKNNEHHEKSVRQLAQEARAGNAHDENVLSYYRCPPAPELRARGRLRRPQPARWGRAPQPPRASCLHLPAAQPPREAPLPAALASPAARPSPCPLHAGTS